MTLSRRRFLAISAGGAATVAGVRLPFGGQDMTATAGTLQATRSRGAFDPWLEIDAAALRHNIGTIARLAGSRPILVVAKNNAYGLGLGTVGPILDPLSQVAGFAVVRPDEALALRAAGVRKPILLMAPVAARDIAELIERDVLITPFDELVVAELARSSRERGRPAGIHLYVDTGMSRLGVPAKRIGPLLDAVTSARGVRVDGIMTELTEDVPFDAEQATALRRVADELRRRGVAPGRLHAASSAAIWRQPETHLDMVRPGLGVYGGYVSAEAMRQGELRAAYRLRAPVLRVERLDVGDGVSYHRRWVAKEPTWVATLPVGHVDGYPARAVDGCEVLVGGRLYRVIGTVSASHTIIEVGPEPTVRVGDVATLVGPDAPAIHPNEIARRSGWSEYNMFMHLGPMLHRTVV
jgi:alanine racemase